MFFWMVLASLMGIVMFGDLHDRTKSQEVFVAPIYEAFALNMLQQHAAAEYGYMDLLNADKPQLDTFLNRFADGIVPLATVEDRNMTGVVPDNDIFPYIQNRLPVSFTPLNGTRSYLYCVDKAQTTPTVCTDRDNTVHYVMTIRAIPPRYEGNNKVAALEALGRAKEGSRSVGLLEKAPAPLASGVHQPLGAHYLVLSAGVAPINLPYIPDYILCNAPMSNTDATNVLGIKTDEASYLVVLSLLYGLPHGENLTAGSLSSCPATN